MHLDTESKALKWVEQKPLLGINKGIELKRIIGTNQKKQHGSYTTRVI